MDIIYRVLWEIWATLLQMAPYLLLGYLIAGVLSVFVNPELVKRHLGGNGFLSILKASVLGVPLPLCSCGVIPVTASLRQQGAGRGAAAAFLVATPTIGVDSFMATVGLLGPVMAVYRTLMSVVLGVFGGTMANWLGRDPFVAGRDDAHEPAADGETESACPHCAAARAARREQDACGCSSHEKPAAQEAGCCGTAGEPGQTGNGSGDEAGCHAEESTRLRALALLGQVLLYSFYQLPRAIAKPLLLGIAAAGLISALVKAEVLDQFLGSGPGTYLLMLAIGVPLYVCSTVAIPLALGFMALGASPGAAMIFMLVAPATNAATLGILIKMLGARTTLVLAATLMVGAVAGGLALDYLWTPLGLPGLAELTTAAGAQASLAVHAAHTAHAGGAGAITLALTVFFLLIEINGAAGGGLVRLFTRRTASKASASCCGGK